MKKLLTFMAFFVVGLSGCSEKAPIALDSTSLTADENGSYVISGTQELEATIKLDGKSIDLRPDKKGKFETSISPASPKDEVLVWAQHKDKTVETKLKIDNSKYEKRVAEEKRKKEEAEKKAEEERKLAIEKATNEAKLKVEEAKKELTRDFLTIAQSFVSKIPDGNKDLEDQLVVVEETITENERVAAEKAEQERLAAEKAEADRIAAEQAEAARVQAEAAQAAEEAAAQQAVGDVYVTRTGKRYHAYAHGNGNFWLDSLSNAQARGLTPCQVCW